MRKYTSNGSRIYATSEDAVIQKLSEINDPARMDGTSAIHRIMSGRS
jgi:hypothetical protein